MSEKNGNVKWIALLVTTVLTSVSLTAGAVSFVINRDITSTCIRIADEVVQKRFMVADKSYYHYEDGLLMEQSVIQLQATIKELKEQIKCLDIRLVTANETLIRIEERLSHSKVNERSP